MRLSVGVVCVHTYYRVYPSAAFQARALAGFIHAQGWSRVFVVFSQVAFVQYNSITIFSLTSPHDCYILQLFLHTDVVITCCNLFAFRTISAKIPSQSLLMNAVS